MDEENKETSNLIKTGEAYEYTHKKLTTILNDLLLASTSDNLLKFNTTNSSVLHYKEFVLSKINDILRENKITIDEDITIKGAKKYKYFKERIRFIFNRLISRLDEHSDYDDEEFDSYVNMINGYIYQVGTDYDVELIDLQ